jgi:hypothetical protein
MKKILIIGMHKINDFGGKNTPSAAKLCLESIKEHVMPEIKTFV